MISVPFVLTLVAALGCGVAGGVFFGFSSFVMGALKRLPAPQGIAAMQSMNVVAVTPVFMTALFGTALACLALIARALVARGESGVAYRVAGSVLYLVGVIGVTMVRNVPLNDALAPLDPNAASSASIWPQFTQTWTTWNTVRAITAIAAAALLTLSLVASRTD